MNSRQKGIRGEREAAKLWTRWFPDCRRLYDQSHKGSASPDIGCPEMNKHFWVEVKRCKKFSRHLLDRWVEKMMLDWAGGGVPSNPILMYRADRSSWVVVCGIRVKSAYTLESRCVFWPDFAAALDKHFEIKEDKE